MPHINAVIVSYIKNRLRYIREVARSVVAGYLQFGAAARNCDFRTIYRLYLDDLNITLYKRKITVQGVNRNHSAVLPRTDA